MDRPIARNDLKSRLLRLVKSDQARAGAAVTGSDGQDRVIARKPLWQRYWKPAAVVLIALVGAVWLLAGKGGNVYRAPLSQLTIGAVTEGPFEDYIAVRGAVAPFITAYLTTDQGGTVKRVLVEDGAKVTAGQALIILSNPALQLQVAAQQLTFEQTRFKYQQDLLNIEHQISKLKSDLERDKILLDGNAIAPTTYRQEQEEYNYYVKMRAATKASNSVEQRVRGTQLTGDTSGKVGLIERVPNGVGPYSKEARWRRM
jgi:HlyD family secretion protein